jgi:hypothetical protein
MISPDIAGISALTVQSIFYGLYTATFVHCTRWLIFDDDGWKLRQKMNWIMILMTTLIFIFSTMNLGTSIPLTFDIMPVGYSLPSYFSLNLVNGAFEYATFLVTDGILIYRCWITYGKSWLAISLPLLLIFANTCCMIFVISWEAITIRNQNKIYNHLQIEVWHFPAVVVALSIAINIYATSAIVWRILRVAKGTGTNPTRLYNACRTLVESGGLFTATSIANMIAIFVQSGFVGGITDAINFSMSGIAFNLILIRVYAQRVDGRVNGRANGRDGLADSQQENTKAISALRFQTPDDSTLAGMSSVVEVSQDTYTATDTVEEARRR